MRLIATLAEIDVVGRALAFSINDGLFTTAESHDLAVQTLDYVDSLVSTDCCDVLRPADETDVALDSNGDVDVRVCRTGMGCLA